MIRLPSKNYVVCIFSATEITGVYHEGELISNGFFLYDIIINAISQTVRDR